MRVLHVHVTGFAACWLISCQSPPPPDSRAPTPAPSRAPVSLASPHHDVDKPESPAAAASASGSVQAPAGNTSVPDSPPRPPAPAVLAADQKKPAHLAVDGTSVYWTNEGDGTVMKIGVQGGTPVVLASKQRRPMDIVVDATHVYWANFAGGTIMRLPKEGGNPTVLVRAQRMPKDLSLDASSVYWCSSYQGIMKAGLRGGTVTQINKSGESMEYVTMDHAGRFYWVITPGTSGDGEVVGYTPGRSEEILSREHQSPCGIAVDDTHVYFTGDSALMKVGRDGGTEVKLVEPAQCPVAVDDANVYYTTFNRDVINKVSKRGGTPTTLASNLKVGFGGIAVDATSVYWANGEDSVMRVAK